MRVSPELHLGPAKPPPPNPFTEVFGQGASTKGFDAPTRPFDYRRREFGRTQRADWSPEWSTSLKEMIARVTDIAPSRQRLTFRHAPMAIDEMPLRTYGISSGDTLQMRVLRAAPAEGRETTLACTRRKQIAGAQQQHGAGSSGWSLRDSALLANCKADGDIWLMPRWVSQANPQLFAPVGIGIDGRGGHRALSQYAETPIFLSDANNGKMQSVRERIF